MRLRSLMLLAGMALSTLPMMANTIYTYTGNSFTTALGSYTTSDSITGSFTVSGSLGDNFSLQTVTPESFSFSDGIVTLTNLNTTISGFTVSTDATGDILQWSIDVGGGGIIISTENEPAVNDSTNDASNSDAAGTWVAVSTVPEPSSLALLGTGALGLVGAARRRFVRR